MLNKFTSNRTSNIYLNAASELNLDFTILDGESGYSMIYSDDKQLYLIGDRLSVNDIVAKEFADNKELSIRILAGAGLPTPTQITINLNDDCSSTLYDFLEAHKSIVLKPVDGRAGANVFLRLDSRSKIDSAAKILKQNSVEKVLCEKFVEGENYRVLMFKGEIIDIIERKAAYVVGNGASTISELIDAKNEQRAKLGTKSMIKISSVDEFLSESEYNLESILEDKQELTIADNIYFLHGGETIRINLDALPLENIDIFKKSCEISRLNFSGIDIISSNILKPFSETNGVINEINNFPGMAIHFYAGMQNNLEPAKKILNNYFNQV